MSSSLNSLNGARKFKPDRPRLVTDDAAPELAEDTAFQNLKNDFLTRGLGKHAFEVRYGVHEQIFGIPLSLNTQKNGDPAKGRPRDLHLTHAPRTNPSLEHVDKVLSSDNIVQLISHLGFKRGPQGFWAPYDLSSDMVQKL